MKKKVLLTGGTGFIGRSILPELREKYDVCAPTRHQLDIKNTNEIEKFVSAGNYGVIILAGIPTLASHSSHLEPDVLQSCLLSFMNFYRLREQIDKIIYFGSGAEFNKRMEICSVEESHISQRLPIDPYGLAKYTMNELAENSRNIYNLRLFGCYGPTDAATKFITHCINCCIDNRAITIRQNCIFDYLYVGDLVPILNHFIETPPSFHSYNICSGQRISLTEIADIVNHKMRNKNKVQIADQTMGKEYTGSNKRLCKEVADLPLTPIETGIELQINKILENLARGRI